MEKNLYTVSYRLGTNHLLDISYTLSGLRGETVQIQLPSWRPGRYELGNFAKNIQRFEVRDAAGNALPFRKVSTHRWEVQSGGADSITCNYVYYAADLNAGSTFVNGEQLYMNPVNCLMYCPDRIDHPCELSLVIPENYRIASPLPLNGRVMTATSCHELFDSPFICSATIRSESFVVEGVRLWLHFQGVCRPDMDRLKLDFSRFFINQLEIFGEFPVKEYHFLFQIMTTSFHHGVEHQNNTVIAMGPGHSQFTTAYKEFLGISSHELFHAWNIKAIRPAELWPYDYTKENYTNLGYVAEGVTTLMGDVCLLRAGVWSPDDFLDEFSRESQKHFDNFGRFNHSVAQSGFDSWLDGYTAGIPHRKVSIYTEGMILAFICDTIICRESAFRYSLNNVLHDLYHGFYKQGKGFTEEDYIQLLEKYAGISFREFFTDYIWGTKDDRAVFEEALSFLGLRLDVTPSANFAERRVGVKLSGNGLVTAIHPGSIAERDGLWIDDRIVAINGVETLNEGGPWMEFFKEEEMVLTLWRQHYLVDVPLRVDRDDIYFKYYRIRHREGTPSTNFIRWMNLRRNN